MADGVIEGIDIGYGLEGMVRTYEDCLNSEQRSKEDR